MRGTSSFAYRYGPETFPLVRSQKFSSNGDIHTMDSVIVLAGSTTADAKGARTGSTPYVVNSAEKNGDAPLASSGRMPTTTASARRMSTIRTATSSPRASAASAACASA